MAQFGSTQRNLQTFEWYPHSVYNEAAARISQRSCFKQFCNKDINSNVATNKQHDSQSGIRKSRNVPELHIDVFSDPQTRWRCTTNFQPQTVEQLYKGQEVSIVQPHKSTLVFTKQRLDGQTRFEPGLLPPTHSSPAPQIPESELQRSPLPNDLSPFWPVSGPRNLRCSYQLDCGLSEETQYSLCGVSGRFHADMSILPTTTGPGEVYNNFNAISRMDNQLQQISSGSDTTPRVFRGYLGHANQYQVPVGTKMPNATQGITETDLQRQLVPQTGPVPNGETQLCLVRRSQREATLSNNAVLQPTIATIPTTPTIQNTGSSSYRNELVGESGIQLITFTHGTRFTPAYDRCLRHRLGCAAESNVTIRSMDGGSAILARQLQRVICRSCSDSSQPPAAEGRTHTIADGQSHSSGLHKQRRWHKVKEAARSNKTTSSPTGSPQREFDSEILPRSVQHRRRRVISQQNQPRMASSSSSDEGNIQNVGNTRSGPLRIQDSTCGTGLCLPGSTRRKSPIPQCLSPPLEVQVGLVVPAAQSHTTSARASEFGPRSVHINNTAMGESILDGRLTAKSDSSTVSNPRPSTSTDRHDIGPSSTRGTENILGSMADSRWADLIKDWSGDEKSLLLSSWRKSTLNTYIPAWNKWKNWCMVHSIDFKIAEPSAVARYLAYLHNNEGLAYRTILVHKSAISTFTKTSEQEVSSNFLVKQILRAISVSKVKKPKPPIWNPRQVLEHLSANSPDQSNLYQVSRRAAILLLLASGRRVHDLTLLRIGPEHLLDEENSLIMWPAFGSKTDTANHQQSGWKITQHPDINLNAIYWIRLLIKLSQHRRREGNWSELFITTRGESRPATRTIIAGWVKAVLREAGIEAPPGTIRSAVSSLNWLENYNMDQILSTGNWKQEHTFRTYYHKQIKDFNHSQSNVSLSQYFKAM